MGRVAVEYMSPTGFVLGITPFAANVTRTWVVNDVGTADITFAIGTPNLSNIIAWGNIYTIWETGIAPWIGICEDRDWEQSSITLHLKSAEQLLAKHITRQGFTVPAGSLMGTIARQMFDSAVTHNDPLSLLKAGIMDAQKPHFLQYDYQDILDAWKQITTDDKSFFWVDEHLNTHFRDNRGADLSASVVLFEGRHLTDPKLTESIAESVTNIVAIGNGDDMPSRPKKAIQLPNGMYHRAEVLSLDNALTSEALYGPAVDELRKRGLPKTTIDCTVENAGGIWAQFGIGDIVRLVIYSRDTPTDMTARVIGIEIGDTDDMRCIFDITPLEEPGSVIEWVLS